MRITLLVNYDPAAALALALLSAHLHQHHLSVFYTRRAVSPQAPPKLAALADFEQRLMAKHTDIFTRLGARQLNSINTSDFEEFKQSQPDLVISIRHMTILQDAVIAVPQHGVINLHSGLLPQYQGVMATFWAMRDRQPLLGTTLHRIEDAGIDTGAIVSQAQVATDYQRSYLHNALSLYPSGCRLIADAVKTIDGGGNLASETQSGPSQYFSFPDQGTLDQCQFTLFDEGDSLTRVLDQAD